MGKESAAPCILSISSRMGDDLPQPVEVILVFLSFVVSWMNHYFVINSDCTVKLWSLDAFFRCAETKSPLATSKALLATLTGHTKSVNVVRWSKLGGYIATGGDDQYILIHRHTPQSTSNQAFGAKTTKNLEPWSTLLTLQGHSMDVLDLDWCVTGWLASGSVDNKVILWRICDENGDFLPSTRIMGPTLVLSGHNSFVKGVSFDPLGRYLVSCGDDRIVNIWNAQNNWQLSDKLTEPLKHASDKVMFRRISWSPDGSSFCLTSAMKNNLFTGMILRRNDWQNVVNLDGYAPTVSARFCPQILSSSSSSSDTTSPSLPFCLLALGDQEGVLSLWSSDRIQPLLVLSDAFASPVADISWQLLSPPPQPSSSSVSSSVSSVVLRIVACSISGEVLAIELDGTQDACGNVICDPLQLTQHYETLYGAGFHVPECVLHPSLHTPQIPDELENDMFVGQQQRNPQQKPTQSATSKRQQKQQQQLQQLQQMQQQPEGLLVGNPLAMKYAQPSKKANGKAGPHKASNTSSTTSSLAGAAADVIKQKNSNDQGNNASETTSTASTTAASTPTIGNSAAVAVSSSTPQISSTTAPTTPSNTASNTFTASTSAATATESGVPSNSLTNNLNGDLNNSICSFTAAPLVATVRTVAVVGKDGKKRIRPVLLNDGHNESNVNDDLQESYDSASAGVKRIKFADTVNTSAAFSSASTSNTATSNGYRTTTSAPNNGTTNRNQQQLSTLSVTNRVLAVRVEADDLVFESSLASFTHRYTQHQQDHMVVVPVVQLSNKRRGHGNWSETGYAGHSSGGDGRDDETQLLSQYHVVVTRVQAPATLSSRFNSNAATASTASTSVNTTNISNSSATTLLSQLTCCTHDPHHLSHQQPPLPLQHWQCWVPGEISALRVFVCHGSRSSRTKANNGGAGDLNGSATYEMMSMDLDSSSPHLPSASQNQQSSCGVVLIGTVDGLLHLHDLATGLALRTPLVLGTMLVNIDLIASASSSSSSSTTSKYKLLAMTSDGGVFLWDFQLQTHLQPQPQLQQSPSGLGQTGSYGSSGSELLAAIVRCQLRKRTQVDLRPLFRSIKAAAGTSPNTSDGANTVLRCVLHVDECRLHPLTGALIVAISSFTSPSSSNSASSNGKGQSSTSAGKQQSCQWFAFEDGDDARSGGSGCWTRVGDSRTALFR